MTVNTKKFIFLGLFILISIGLAFLIYYVFFAPKKPSQVIIPVDDVQGGEFPKAGPGSIQTIGTAGEITTPTDLAQSALEDMTRVSEELKTTAKEVVAKNISQIQSYSNVNNGMVYYDDLNESFYRVDSSGAISKLSDKKFYSVTNTTFSPTKNQAIIEYPDNTKVLYDFERDEFIARFPEQATDFGFSSTGDKLSYKWVDYYQDQNYLVTSNSDASNVKFIRPIADQAKNINNVWSPDGEVMATFRKQYDIERQEIYFINEYDKNLRSLIVDGLNFEGVWSKNGDKLFYNVTEIRNDFKPSLWIANGQGDELGYGKMSLGVNTWIDKCSFSQTNNSLVYCAVPDELPRGSGLNPDLAKGVPYSIYKINIQTGGGEIIAQPIINNRRASIDTIYTSANDSNLYYIDSINGYLYSIDLR